MSRPPLLERSLYRLSFVLFLALTARFGWVVARHSWDKHTEVKAADSPAAKPPSLLAQLQQQAALPLLASSSIDSVIAQAIGSTNAAASAASAAAPAPQYFRSYISVRVGPSRSELRLDGVLVGHTPYVGQITCQRGRTVKINLLPPKGMPKDYEIPCLDGEMRLLDEP